MKTKLKKLLSNLMFLIFIGLIFHFLFFYLKSPEGNPLSVFKQFIWIYITGVSTLMLYFIWGNFARNI